MLKRAIMRFYKIPIVSTVVNYIFYFCKWTVLAALVGAVSGLIGGGFHHVLERVTAWRTGTPLLLWFLPLGGLFIVFLYQVTGMQNNRGINTVMESVRSGEHVRLVTVPLIFIATAVTHLFGGSAGREGAALQLGAGIGGNLARLLRFSPKEIRLMLLAGMAGTFSALFGTPLAATLFSVEFISVGVIYYSGIYSALVSSLTALGVARLIGVHYTVYPLVGTPSLAPLPLLSVLVFAVLIALAAILFCGSLHTGEHLMKCLMPNPYLRISFGGFAVIALTLLFGTAYLGASVPLLDEALLFGRAPGFAFLLKMLFTVVTVSAGYRGGEIVPSFCIGATLGVLAGPVLGLDASFAAALGTVGMFCAVTNAPLASVLLAAEMFGGGGLPFFALIAAASYLLSANFSLYESQLFLYSKHKADFAPAAAAEEEMLGEGAESTS